jgi:hypothetical protein
MGRNGARRSLWLVLYSENGVGAEMRGIGWAGSVAGVAESEMPRYRRKRTAFETWA